MRRLLSPLLAILALLPFTSALTAGEPKQASPTDPWYSAHVQVDLGGGATTHGSGTLIGCEDGRSLILTNAHVCESAQHPVTCTIAGRTYPARYEEGSTVSYVTPTQIRVDGPDLCVLSIAADLDYVQVAESLPAEGAAVWQCGFGGGVGPTLRRGYATANRCAEPTLTSTIPTIQGDSGSGVFDSAGSLVGVTWGAAEGTSYAVHVTTVHRFLLRDRLRAAFPRLAARVGARHAPQAPRGTLSAPAPIPAVIPTPMPPPRPVQTPAPVMVPHYQRAGLFGRRTTVTYTLAPGGYGVGSYPQTGGCPGGVCPLPRR
jgi:S1-C subfamily serine protease